MHKYILLSFVLFVNVANAQFSNGQNGSYFQTPSNTLNNAAVFTVEFWVKTTDNRSNNLYWQRPYLFGAATDGDNSGDMGITINNGYIGMWEGISNLNTDQVFLSNSVRISDNFWHHIAAVNNGQTMNLYVDGNIVGSLVTGRTLRTFNTALTFGAASVDQKFGGSNNNINFYSQASFGDAKISSIARYSSNFTPDNNAYQQDENTVAVYRFGNNNSNNNYGNNNSVNTVLNADPNYPVTFDKDQPINNNYAQPVTLFVNDSVVVYGKLLLAKKDWSFNTEIGIHFWANGSKKMKYLKPSEIKGFKMGNNYFVPKFLGAGGPVSTPFAKTIVRQLTAQGSRINMYEFIAQTGTKNANGSTQYQTTIVHFVEIPHSTDDKIYQFSDNKFVPHFDTRVSSMVADKPELAEKIKSKNKDYFYAQVTEQTHQEKVWANIVNEYNQ
ncbi:MAG: LamG domain-containing protein [Ferruginibacter sp.]